MTAPQSFSHPLFSPASTVPRRATIVTGGGILATLLVGAQVDRAHAQATPEETREVPNHFLLAGDGIEIEYATTSIGVQPHFAYRGPEGDLEFSGEEIEVVRSLVFGQLVTVLLEVVHDGYTLDLSLLLPEINLAGGNEPTPFSTLAILTKHLTTIAGPGLIEGALKEYDAVELRGTAELVVS